MFEINNMKILSALKALFTRKKSKKINKKYEYFPIYNGNRWEFREIEKR